MGLPIMEVADGCTETVERCARPAPAFQGHIETKSNAIAGLSTIVSRSLLAAPVVDFRQQTRNDVECSVRATGVAVAPCAIGCRALSLVPHGAKRIVSPPICRTAGGSRFGHDTAVSTLQRAKPPKGGDAEPRG
jgi:hypothetical protein